MLDLTTEEDKGQSQNSSFGFSFDMKNLSSEETAMANLEYHGSSAKTLRKLLHVLWMLKMLSYSLLLLIIFGIVDFPESVFEHSLSPLGAGITSRKIGPPIVCDFGPRNETWHEFISHQPWAIMTHNFMSKEECEHLISLAKPHMSNDSRVPRMFLSRGQDEIVKCIEKRIAEMLLIPVENGEGLQILHYEAGQKYEPYSDYFLDMNNTRNGSRLRATALMYLSDVEEGCETVFPAAKANASSVPWWNKLFGAKEGPPLKPKRGDAIFIESKIPGVNLDPFSLHGDFLVVKENKWFSTKWVHAGEYRV